MSCEASLRRIGVDALDVFFFHSPFKPDEIHDDVWGELDKLKDEGKIRFLAHSVSLYEDTAGMSADWMRERKIDVIQVVLSPFNREARPLIQAAIDCDCGVVARECLANGFLSGGITKDTVFPEGSLNARYSRDEIAERVDYATKHVFRHVDRCDALSTTDFVSLFDLVAFAEEYGANVVFFEVENHARNAARREFEKLTSLHFGQAVDTGDTVTYLKYGTDFIHIGTRVEAAQFALQYGGDFIGSDCRCHWIRLVSCDAGRARLTQLIKRALRSGAVHAA